MIGLAKQRIRSALLPLVAKTLSRPPAGDLNTILILQPDHLGDIILSQPAVRLIRERNPEARLIGVVGPWSVEIARMAWPVDDLITVEFPGFSRQQSGELLDPYRLLSIETRRLRQLHAGRAFILRSDAWWAAWLAAQSVSDAVVTSNDSRLKPFATETVNLNSQLHSTERALAIASGIDGFHLLKSANTSIRIPPSRNDSIEREFQAPGTGGKSYVIVHPGSGAPVKLWPVHRWRDLISRMGNFRILITGSQGEKVLCDQISEGFSNVANIAGSTDVQSLVEVIRQAELAIGTDNGPMHIAVATGTSSVHLFGPSDPQKYGPWGDLDRHRIVATGWGCPKCGDLNVNRVEGCGCMLSITANEVNAVVHEQLAKEI